jgi:hypothetical protein
MANPVGVSPNLNDFTQQRPQLNGWFKEVTTRFKTYTGASDPVAAEIPDGQWIIHRNTTSGTTKLWYNWGGVVGSIGSVTFPIAGDITTTGGKIGYATGAGGTVTQLVSKTTGVTLNKLTGQITLFAGTNINAGRSITFVLTNSFISAGDLLVVNHVSGGTAGIYQTSACNIVNGAANITVSNVSGGGEAAALVIGFAVIKAVTS